MIRIALHLILLLAGLCAASLVHAQHGLVINEIMANPNDGQLPGHEYIELYNNSTAVVQLAEFRLMIGTNSIDLPSYRLSPRQFVVLCNETAENSLRSYGNVLPLQRWPALNNSAGTIRLLQGSHLQDSVTYSDTWYKNSTKRRGGWSLERINPNITCNSAVNWTASVNPMGGTPSRANAVLNTNPPAITLTEWSVSGDRISLTFNEPMDYFDLSDAQFKLTPEDLQPNRVEINEEGSLDVFFSKELPANQLYYLQISDLHWCAHPLHLEDTPIFVQSGLTYNDVVINEILFNPKPGGVDFVELFNQSEHVINLQGWTLGNRLISSDILILHPQRYLALSTSSPILLQHYRTAEQQELHQMPSLPAYPNQQGNVLLHAGTTLIDSVYYNAAMHSPFLKDAKGISLERQSPDRPSDEASNFLSASTNSGGATPGYRNSTQSAINKKNNTVFLSSKTLSPDDDSFEDYLEINYELDASNYMINVDIYSDKGTLINRLIKQQSAGFRGKITWDGRGENGYRCRPGIYLCLIEIYDDKGHRQVIKEAFVLTYMHVGT